MRHVLKLLIVICMVSAALAGCTQMERVVTKMRPRYAAEVTPVMRREFDLAEFHYRRRHFDEANHFYQEYIARYPHNALTDEAYYKQGKLHFLKRDYGAAIASFENLAKLSPSQDYRSKAWHLSGYSSYKSGDYAGAVKTLKKVKEASLPAKLRLQYYSVLIRAAKAANEDETLTLKTTLSLFDLYREHASALRYLRAPDLINYDESQRLLDAWLMQPLTPKQLPSWLSRYPMGVAKPYVDFKIAKTYFEAGNTKRARRLLTVFVQSYAKHDYHAAAVALLARVGGPETLAVKTRSKETAFRLGVLAPMGGERGGYGASVLQGVKCAVGADGLCGGSSRVEVLVKDSGETGNSVKQAMTELKGASVAAVVGILPGELAVEGSIAASEQKLPLFLISQKSGLMRQSDHVYQMGLTTEQQITELVRAARDRGLKNFAVFFPSIRYGITMADLFVKDVLAQGGKIVVKTPYERRTPDLFAEARKLKNDARLTGRAAFDAIFIPDTYAAVNALVGALEFNGIKGVPLLGTNTWNHPGLAVDRIESVFPGSFFVDLYDAASKLPENQKFKQDYLQATGQEPQVLQALGYDAAAFIKQLVNENGENHVQKMLATSPSLRGVTGIRGFKSGEGPVIMPLIIDLKSIASGPAL